MKKIVNFIIFQFIWFICIYGAATNHETLAITLAIWGVAINLYLGCDLKKDLLLLVKGIFLGILIDTFLIQLNVISFNTQYWKVISPLWMWCVWAGFLTTVNYSLSWLKERLVLGAILGGVMGPISYWSGVSLGAGQFDHLGQFLLVISIAWLLATPFILKMSKDASQSN